MKRERWWDAGRNRSSGGLRWRRSIGVLAGVMLAATLTASPATAGTDKPTPDPSGHIGREAGIPFGKTTGSKVGPRNGELRREAELGTLGADPSADRAALEVVMDGVHPAADVRAKIDQVGGHVLGGVADLVVEADLPVGSITAIEAMPGVRIVRPPRKFSVPSADPAPDVAGAETSLMNLDAWHAAGFNGQGVKVGIIDFFGTTPWNASRASGAVPDPAGTFCRAEGTTCNPFTVYGDGDPHGTAVAEIIHEQAPAAQLYLASISTVSDFQAAVDYFVSQGVTIVNWSLLANYDGPGDGTGPLDAVVTNAVANGIAFVNAAGNSGGDIFQYEGSYWRGSWVDADSDGFIEFAPGDEQLGIDCYFGDLTSLGLRWSDWGTNATNYDIGLFDEGGAALYISDDIQGSGAPPLENNLGDVNTGDICAGRDVVFAEIRLTGAGNGTSGDVLEFQVNNALFERWQNPYSAATGVADSASPGAITVGAIDPASSGNLAPYSSQGPTNDNRAKPDLVAPSCVSTVAYGGFCFSGTSAATPAVSGAAAVVKSAGLASTPAQLKSYLLAASVDRGAAGVDSVYGSGQLVLPAPAGTGDWFHPLSPTRILDSRPSGPQVGPYNTPWATGTTRDIQVTGGSSGVPAGADAVALNVTVAGTNASSYLTVWPAGGAKPTVSSLNWDAGWVIPNAVTVKLSDLGKISVYNHNGTANVLIDVVGYYSPASGDGFTSLNPARILDSRSTGPQVGPYNTPWATGTTRDIQVTGGSSGVPAGADAVALNVTVAGTNAPSYLTVWPAGGAKPTASSLNWLGGWVIPNAVTVKLSDVGKISVYNHAGSADVLIDVVGYFASGSGKQFHPLFPSRIQDSRQFGPQAGPFSTPWAGQETRSIQVTGSGGVPGTATSVLLNVTAAETSTSSFLTVWPAGGVKPTASSLNWFGGWVIPNSVTAKLSSSGKVSIYNNSGTVHVIADAAGWYG